MKKFLCMIICICCSFMMIACAESSGADLNPDTVTESDVEQGTGNAGEEPSQEEPETEPDVSDGEEPETDDSDGEETGNGGGVWTPPVKQE